MTAGESTLQSVPDAVFLPRKLRSPRRSAAADPGRYDVLITDFSMPGMTGLNAASKFIALNPGLPVLLVTGLDPDISDAELAAAGICRTLIKPYSLADLSRAVSESLG